MIYADDATVLISRADDSIFGILHSRFRELWSLRLGASLEDRPRFTPTTCFETFPFPAGLTRADTAPPANRTLLKGAQIRLAGQRARHAGCRGCGSLLLARHHVRGGRK